MTDWLINLDHSITLGLNGMHTPFWNEVMLFLSAKTVWIPLYAAIAILFFVPRWYGKKSQAFISGSRIPLWLTGLIGVMAVLLCFGITEQITNIVKDLVARPRPGHEPLLEGLLQLPEGKGGRYGFFLRSCCKHIRAGNTHGFNIPAQVVFCIYRTVGSRCIIQPDLSGQTLYHRCSVRSRCRHPHRPGRILSVQIHTVPDIPQIHPHR